jgi:hypothetical protein
MSASAIAASPRSAAQWSGVMPSGCGMLASAPCFSSVRIVARSPRLAASATGAAVCCAMAIVTLVNANATTSPSPTRRVISASLVRIYRIHMKVEELEEFLLGPTQRILHVFTLHVCLALALYDLNAFIGRVTSSD